MLIHVNFCEMRVLCLFFWLGRWVCTLMQRFFEGVIEGHADHPEVTRCGWQDFKIKEQTNCTSVLISSKGLDAQITSPTLQRGGETCWWNQYMNPVPPPSRFKYLNYSATSLLRSSNEKKMKKSGDCFLTHEKCESTLGLVSCCWASQAC